MGGFVAEILVAIIEIKTVLLGPPAWDETVSAPLLATSSPSSTSGPSSWLKRSSESTWSDKLWKNGFHFVILHWISNHSWYPMIINIEALVLQVCCREHCVMNGATNHGPIWVPVLTIAKFKLRQDTDRPVKKFSHCKSSKLKASFLLRVPPNWRHCV